MSLNESNQCSGHVQRFYAFSPHPQAYQNLRWPHTTSSPLLQRYKDHQVQISVSKCPSAIIHVWVPSSCHLTNVGPKASSSSKKHHGLLQASMTISSTLREVTTTKRKNVCWNCWMLNRYHIMHVPMIVLYIEVTMKTKGYVQNVGMAGIKNWKTRLNHMVLFIRYWCTC